MDQQNAEVPPCLLQNSKQDDRPQCRPIFKKEQVINPSFGTIEATENGEICCPQALWKFPFATSRLFL
jgi:hypothetical protein